MFSAVDLCQGTVSVWWELRASDKFRTDLQISKVPAHCCLCQFLVLCRCRVWQVGELLHCGIVLVSGLTWSKGYSALETLHFHKLDHHRSSTTSLNLALSPIFHLRMPSCTFIQMTFSDHSMHCTLFNVSSLFKNALKSLQTLQPSLRNLGSSHLWKYYANCLTILCDNKDKRQHRRQSWGQLNMTTIFWDTVVRCP